MGRVFKRGKDWHVEYRRNGKQYHEGSRPTIKGVAEKLLIIRKGQTLDLKGAKSFLNYIQLCGERSPWINSEKSTH